MRLGLGVRNRVRVRVRISRLDQICRCMQFIKFIKIGLTQATKFHIFPEFDIFWVKVACRHM